MTRQNVFQYPKIDEFGDKNIDRPTVVGHFNIDKAEKFDELRHRVGNNLVSVHTADPHAHQELYSTVGGRWVLHCWSQWQGSEPTWVFVSDKAAHAWLVLNEDDDAVAQHFKPLEEERGPGRPEEGRPIQIRLPKPMIDALDKRAELNGVSRAEVIRQLCAAALA